MTKISKKSAYPVKIPVRKDYFVGTDSENNGKTVNFDFESTARLINDLNGTPILNYIFRTDSNIDLTVLTEGVFLSAGNETTITSISKLYINKNNFHETDMSDLFRFIAINREAFSMKLRNSSNLTNAVYFKITGATEYETHFTLDVAIDINNASLLELINYNVYFFDFELSSSDLAITLPEFNKIITETGFTSTETEITFNPLWVWLIKNVSYSNNSSVTKITTPTTIGSKRIDVFVLNSSNTFQTISGAETTGSPVKPTIPLDTLEVTFCIVGDGGIETVEPINIIDYATIVYVDSKDALKVDKVTGKSLLLDTEITRLSTVMNFDNSVNTTALATKVDKVANKSLIADSEITRLATLTNYTHPTNHPPSIITQDASNRFVTDAEKATWNAKQSALGYTAENSANKNIANGYAGLGSDGKLISSQLPSITISDTFVTASQAAMLALTSAETGDVAVRTDLNKSFILKGTNYSVLTDWQELLTPTSAVTTVFGRNGAVGAQTGDYNAEQITETVTRVFQTPTQKANNDATSSIQTQLNSKQATITAGTTSQYYRGDKTFQTLDKTAVGLANVDNTSDDNKPISTLTQTALNLKENTSNKQNSLTADGTGVKFPTVDAVNAGLGLKASLTGAIFTGTPIAPTLKLTNLSDKYIPYNNSSLGLINSPIMVNGTDVSTDGIMHVVGALNINSDFKILNKASTDWINFATRDISGDESVLNLSRIGDVTIGKTATLNGKIRQTYTAVVTDPFYDAFLSEYSSDFNGYNYHAIRSGSGTGGAIGAANNSTGIGSAIIANRYAGGEGNGIEGSKVGPESGDGVFGINSGGGTGNGTSGIISGGGSGHAIYGENVNGSGNSGYFLGGNGVRVISKDDSASSFSLIVGGATTTGLVVNGNGNTGVGVFFPSEKLEVNGNVKASSFNGSATLTGTPTAPTATAGTNTTQIATTAFVLANSEVATNKQNSLAVDVTNTKYPTVTAVNTGLETKQNIINNYNGQIWGVLGDSFATRGIYQPALLLKLGITTITNEVAGSCITGGTNFAEGDGTNRVPFVDRIDSVLASSITGIIIQGGLNDFYYSVPLGDISSNSNTTFYGALKEILLKCVNRATATNVRLILPTVRQTTKAGGSGRSLYEAELTYVNAMKEVAALYSVTCIDEFFGSGITYENLDILTTDGAHPSVTGVEYYNNYLIANFDTTSGLAKNGIDYLHSTGDVRVNYNTGKWGDFIIYNGESVPTVSFIDAKAIFGSDISTEGSITIGTGGSVNNGSIFSNANFGMYFKSKQVSPALSWFEFVDTNGDYKFRIKENNSADFISAVFSGTTTAGNTPPIANNQLTRKDYVDTGLDLKANLESPTLTGTPTAPTATSGTNTTQIATTAFVQANARPYKVYTALLNQTGTNAPVATVLENTLGGVIVWSRDGDVAGHYTGTLTGVFLTDPFYLTNNFGAANAPINVEIQRINNNSILLWTRIGTSTADGLLNGKTSIEIRVYN